MSSSRLLTTSSTHIKAVQFCPKCAYRLLPAEADACDVCARIPSNQMLCHLDELFLKIPLVLCGAAILVICLVVIFGER
jgi:hypothetical protein